MLVTVASFALDLSTARIAASSLTRPRIRGWLAGLALALLLALVVSLVIGALRALSSRSAAAPRPDPLDRVRAWLWGGDPAQQRGRVASLLGASWGFAVYALGAFWLMIVAAQRRLTAGGAQAPELLEPADVAELPARRVDDRQPGAELRLGREIAVEGQRPPARVGDPGD